jgi:predicted enzyme related to lactoylglutathione lyase
MSTMNPVVHFEMPYDDRERMAAFYRTVFGWQIQMLGEDMGNYVVVATADRDVKSDAFRGAIGGGFYDKHASGASPHPSFVLGVDDIEESMGKIREAGGTILGDPQDIPGVGRYVSFLDTEGNRASVLQPSPRM